MKRTISNLASRLFTRSRVASHKQKPARRLNLLNLEERVTPVTASFTTTSSSLTEGTPPGSGGTTSITITLDQPAPSNAAVYLSTQDGSATSGMPPDYFVLTYYSVPIPYGSTSTTFHPAAYADSLVEGDETFTVNIVGASNLSVGSPSSHTVTILNDDQYTLKFTQSSVTVGEAAGNANLTVQISQQPTSNVTVDYQSANGSATSGSDYTAVGPTTLTFTPTGPTSQSFNVPITNDTAWESTENFTVSLSNASGANIVSPSTATVNITDNDTPLFSMANSTYSVNEDDGSITVTVNLSIAPPSGQSYSVDYATANVTARAGADYGSASGTITFNAGETSKTRTVSIVDDIFRETDETFTFTLSNPTGVPLPKTLAA